MKFRAEYMIPIVILFFVILISLCDSCMFFMPYDAEGYENINVPLNFSESGSNVPTTPIVTMKSKKEGFDLLQNSSSEYGTEKSLDIYSQAEGNLNCESSPYSNSMGYLCMDENQKKALQTRGYNQTGSNMQIGQA
jgi:hypothetical protein